MRSVKDPTATSRLTVSIFGDRSRNVASLQYVARELELSELYFAGVALDGSVLEVGVRSCAVVRSVVPRFLAQSALDARTALSSMDVFVIEDACAATSARVVSSTLSRLESAQVTVVSSSGPEICAIPNAKLALPLALPIPRPAESELYSSILQRLEPSRNAPNRPQSALKRKMSKRSTPNRTSSFHASLERPASRVSFDSVLLPTDLPMEPSEAGQLGQRTLVAQPGMAHSLPGAAYLESTTVNADDSMPLTAVDTPPSLDRQRQLLSRVRPLLCAVYSYGTACWRHSCLYCIVGQQPTCKCERADIGICGGGACDRSRLRCLPSTFAYLSNRFSFNVANGIPWAICASRLRSSARL